jgi:hypothetical protein
MPKEKEAGPGRSAPKNNVSDNQAETTPEEPIVKGSRRDMVAKADSDAGRGQRDAEYFAREKFNAVLDELKKAFPESLPVFVACHRASKKPVAPWKGLNQNNWAEPDNLRLLARQIVMGGNLAVKLGRDSDNLVTVDLDHNDHIEPFLQANPAFRNTLRTFGSKGGQFWFYATDDYPREVRKLEINGSTENAGEFRGGKCISVIWGIHEKGNIYNRVNDVPPIKFASKDIVWPTGSRVLEPKNNFKLSRDGNQNTDPPTGRRSNRRVDWHKFNETLRNGNGRAIVECLVKRWFVGAVVEGKEWSCGDITGRAQNGRGSFHISPEGFCIDFDGSWNQSSVVNAIVSDYRRGLTGKNVTVEDVFESIREDTGEDFFKPATGFDRYNVWYVKSKEKFLWHAPDNTWSSLSAAMLKEQLRVVYGLESEIPKDKNGKPTDNKSQVEIVVSDAIQNRRVDFNLRGLAGHEAGIEQLPDGTTYMIERSGRWLEPVKGDWSPIERLINGMFRDRQAEYVLGNLCIWVRDYYNHDYAPRPTMVFAGPKKCGKNLFQEIVVTGILGGTFVDPTQYMTSVTPFNSDLFAAPHQLIADSLHSNDQKTRAILENAIKMVSANHGQRIHGKGKEALNQIDPFWRLTVSLNDDGPGLSVLPRPDGSMADKMLLFRASRPDAMPHTDEDMKTRYLPAIKNAVPAFVYYLLHEHQIRPELKTDRAGIVPYQHPDLVAELVAESREAIVVDKLYQFYFEAKTQQEREKRITLQSTRIYDALVTREAIQKSFDRLKINEQNFGRLLTAIAERPIEGAPVSVVKLKTKGKISYRVSCSKTDGCDHLKEEVEAGRRPPSHDLLELLRKRSHV